MNWMFLGMLGLTWFAAACGYMLGRDHGQSVERVRVLGLKVRGWRE